MSSMIKSHCKKVINKDIKESKSCNCRVKFESPLNGQCQVIDIIYKCTVLSPDKPNKVYLRTAEGDCKRRFYKHRKSFNNEGSANDTTLSKIYMGTKRNIKFKLHSSMVYCQKGTALF